ncbi:hypothetical protein V8C26DRAFT_2608 [Trichoderma gracile]
MTVPFFNIGHACPVQRSYELFLRVEILLSHILFVHLLPAHLSLVCLVKLVVGCPASTLLHCLLLHSPFFFVVAFCPPRLSATRCVIAWVYTAMSHPTEPNSASGRKSFARGVVFFLFLCTFIPALVWVAAPEVVTLVRWCLLLSFLFLLSWLSNGKPERS